MSNKELSKVYEFSNVESKWYKAWESNDCFKPSDSEDTFTIMIPPPNVTGILHIGHILNNTIQDVLIRKARMEGKSTQQLSTMLPLLQLKQSYKRKC